MSVWGTPVLTGAGGGSSVTATGNPAVITGNGGRFTQLECEGLPLIQSGSGDPSPSNIRPILPYSAVNYLWLDANAYNSTDYPIVRGSISSSTGADISSSTRLRNTGYIPIIGGKDYYVAVNLGKIYLHFYTSAQEFISGQSIGWITTPARITVPATAAYLRVVMANADDSSITTSAFEYLWIGEITDEWTWTPSVGENLWFGVVDPARGTLTNARVYLELDGTEAWKLVEHSSGGQDYVRMEVERVWAGTGATGACSHLVYQAYGTIESTSTTKGIRVNVSTGDGKSYLAMRKTSADTVADIKAWLAEQKQAGTPVQVTYGIAAANRVPVPIARQTINSKVGENRIATVQGTSITAALGGESGLIYIS